jgi:hypothetical protein
LERRTRLAAKKITPVLLSGSGQQQMTSAGGAR